METQWQDKLGWKHVFPNRLSNSKGEAILSPPNIDFELCDKMCDNDGRMSLLKVKVKSNIYVLCNI